MSRIFSSDDRDFMLAAFRATNAEELYDDTEGFPLAWIGLSGAMVITPNGGRVRLLGIAVRYGESPTMAVARCITGFGCAIDRQPRYN